MVPQSRRRGPRCRPVRPWPDLRQWLGHPTGLHSGAYVVQSGGSRPMDRSSLTRFTPPIDPEGLPAAAACEAPRSPGTGLEETAPRVPRVWCPLRNPAESNRAKWLRSRTHRFRRGGCPAQESGRAQIFVNVRPVDTVTRTAEPPISTLFGGCVEKPRIPDQGNNYRAPVDEIDR